MEIERSLEADCPASTLFPYIRDLAEYPRWMPLIHDVEAVDDDTWEVELRAKVGPLARSKRLRMARTACENDRLAVFERAEVDGKNHAPWVLRARLDTVEGGTRLTMFLRYGGTLWTGGVLERVLDDQVRRGSEALLELVSAEPTR